MNIYAAVQPEEQEHIPIEKEDEVPSIKVNIVSSLLGTQSLLCFNILDMTEEDRNLWFSRNSKSKLNSVFVTIQQTISKPDAMLTMQMLQNLWNLKKRVQEELTKKSQ
jgi:hypothetical protein